MGRKRKEWDSEYKELLRRRIPGAPLIIDSSSASQEAEIESLAEVKEWRYLMSSKWNCHDSEHRQQNGDGDTWSLVERIIVDHDISDLDRCPICLDSPPIVPRLAKCGHVFCLVCVYKYQQLVGTSCPMCQSALYVFKPLHYSKVAEKQIQLNHPIELYLYTRSRHGTTVVNVDSACADVPWADEKGLIASPEVLASKEYLLQLYNDELGILSKYYEEEDKQYYDRAVQQIKHDMMKLDDTVPHGPTINDAYYYFFQPQGRLRTFLDPLDVKMLVAHYKEYAEFPKACTPVVRNVEIRLVDSNLQSRCRYLDHLSLGTIIRMLSCDWTGIVSNDVISEFQPDIVAKHRPKSPILEPIPFHPELEELAYDPQPEPEPDHFEQSEYIYNRSTDTSTLSDYLSDTITTTLKNGRKVRKFTNRPS